MNDINKRTVLMKEIENILFSIEYILKVTNYRFHFAFDFSEVDVFDKTLVN